jgi:hypothetical protein
VTTTEAPKVPLIHTKLLAIAQGLPELEMSGSYGVGNASKGSAEGAIKYIPMVEITRELKKLYGDHKVMVYPRVLHKKARVDLGRSFNLDGQEVGNGRPLTMRVRQEVTVEYRFVAAEDGSEVTVSMIGEGTDSLDKATRKAITQARRNLYFEMFGVLSPDLDEGTANVPEEPEANDRGAQQRAAARPATAQPAAAPVAATAPATNAQAAVRAASTEADVDNVTALKDEIMALNSSLGEQKLSKEAIDTWVAENVLKKPGSPRANWINKPGHLRRLRDHLKTEVADAARRAEGDVQVDPASGEVDE